MLMNREKDLYFSLPARWLLGQCFYFRGRAPISPRMQETRWFLAKGFPPSRLALFFLANLFEDEANLCIFTNITFDYSIVVRRKI